MPETILRAESVGKTFGGTRVLASASVWAAAGRITALLGRNGSGKTTLLRVAAGLLRPDYGFLEFRGQPYHRPRLAVLARRGLFFLPERGLVHGDLSVREVVELHAAFGSREGRGPVPAAGGGDPPGRAAAALAALEMQARAGERVDELSAGERRQVEVAAAVARRPACLLADEPLLGLAPVDVGRVAATLRTLARRGCAVVVTGQEAREILGLADQVIWMTAGTTHVLGGPAEALAHGQFRREVLGPAAAPAGPVPSKESVAVVIPAPGSPEGSLERFLAVRRPADDEDLPGAWGLPAASLEPGEDAEAAVRRAGSGKLGVELEVVGELERGSLERPGGFLRMRLFEARIRGGSPSVPGPEEGVTQYAEWRWSDAGILRQSARRGSLCSRLHLRHLDVRWEPEEGT